jgi:hypothetical protein
MRSSPSLFLLSLAFAFSAVSADPLAPPGTKAPSMSANSWTPVKLKAAQYLTLPKKQPDLKALAARTQTEIAVIDQTMEQIRQLEASKQPDKNLARRLLGQLQQARFQLQQIGKQLAVIDKARSDRQKQLERMRKDAQQQLADEAIEDSKQTYDAAKEQFKEALRILDEHAERATQVVQKISS